MIKMPFLLETSGTFRLVVGVGAFLAASLAQAATSVTQHGITWTFAADMQTGQYANGDYWVVGPVTITGISPASTIVASRANDSGGTTANSVVNGSMVNPVASSTASHGFDSAAPGYLSSLNAARPGGNDLSPANPLALAAGSSLISTISNPVAGVRPGLTDAAILTVVAAPPPTGTFRPPPQQGDKSKLWNVSSLNYGILRSLAAPVAPPRSLATVTDFFERPWMEINTQSAGRYIHPSNNQPDYGGNMSYNLAEGLMHLHLNHTNIEKEALFIRLVQYGIDVFGAARTGGNWAANGGHNMGRKMPMILAGLALNDAEILSYANAATHFIFQEDQQTFVVTQADVGRPLYTADGRKREPYIQEDVGLAEWGEKHPTAPDRDGRNWDIFYRNTNYMPLMSHALAAHLTPGAVDTWNWEPFFDYMDRAKTIALPSEFGDFVHGMWTSYRNLGAPPPPPPPPPPVTTAPSNAQVSISVQ